MKQIFDYALLSGGLRQLSEEPLFQVHDKQSLNYIRYYLIKTFYIQA